jgi:hypothetical protein
MKCGLLSRSSGTKQRRTYSPGRKSRVKKRLASALGCAQRARRARFRFERQWRYLRDPPKPGDRDIGRCGIPLDGPELSYRNLRATATSATRSGHLPPPRVAHLAPRPGTRGRPGFYRGGLDRGREGISAVWVRAHSRRRVPRPAESCSVTRPPRQDFRQVGGFPNYSTTRMPIRRQQTHTTRQLGSTL